MRKKQYAKLMTPILALFPVFVFYLAAIPSFLPRLIPCMKTGLAQISTSDGCPATHILDTYLMLSFTGSVIISLVIYFTSIKKRIILTTLFLILSSTAVIISYYIYAPYANQIASKAPMILYDPQSQ